MNPIINTELSSSNEDNQNAQQEHDCRQCDEVFQTSGGLTNHIRKVHQQSVVVTYPDGTKSTIKKTDLYFHCCNCYQQFRNPQTMQKHAKYCDISSNSNPVTSIPVVPPPSVDPSQTAPPSTSSCLLGDQIYFDEQTRLSVCKYCKTILATKDSIKFHLAKYHGIDNFDFLVGLSHPVDKSDDKISQFFTKIGWNDGFDPIPHGIIFDGFECTTCHYCVKTEKRIKTHLKKSLDCDSSIPVKIQKIKFFFSSTYFRVKLTNSIILETQELNSLMTDSIKEILGGNPVSTIPDSRERSAFQVSTHFLAYVERFDLEKVLELMESPSQDSPISVYATKYFEKFCQYLQSPFLYLLKIQLLDVDG